MCSGIIRAASSTASECLGTEAWKFLMDRLYLPIYLNAMVTDKERFLQISRRVCEEWGWSTLVPCHGTVERGEKARQMLRHTWAFLREEMMRNQPSPFRASMAPETRRRAAKRRESGDASTVRASNDARGKRRRASMATKGKTKGRGRSAVEEDCGARAPSVSGRSAITLSERDVLSALCERALSNSVPAHVLDQYPDGDEDGGSWADDGSSPAELTASRGNER